MSYAMFRNNKFIVIKKFSTSMSNNNFPHKNVIRKNALFFKEKKRPSWSLTKEKKSHLSKKKA